MSNCITPVDHTFHLLICTPLAYHSMIVVQCRRYKSYLSPPLVALCGGRTIRGDRPIYYIVRYCAKLHLGTPAKIIKALYQKCFLNLILIFLLLFIRKMDEFQIFGYRREFNGFGKILGAFFNLTVILCFEQSLLETLYSFNLYSFSFNYTGV